MVVTILNGALTIDMAWVKPFTYIIFYNGIQARLRSPSPFLQYGKKLQLLPLGQSSQMLLAPLR